MRQTIALALVLKCLLRTETVSKIMTCNFWYVEAAPVGSIALDEKR